MRNIVIIGSDSYLAKGIENFLGEVKLNFLEFNTWQQNIDLLKQADYIICFAIHPEFMKRDMDCSEIIDIQIAETIKDSNAKFVFMSSRKVYGTTNECVVHKETDRAEGFDFYSFNKVKTEKALQDILGDRVLILRIANILGEPVFRTGYKTFIGWICENYIQTGKLEVTQNVNAIKDFIPKDFLHKAISALIENNATGIYNISSGFGTSVEKVLAGYVGKENLILMGQDKEKQDQFILNNDKLLKNTGLSISQVDIDNYLLQCKKILDNYKANV